jgi:glycerol kinase
MSSRGRAILAIDVGTSGTRAGLVAVDGRVSGVNHTPLTVSSPRHSVVEQDADALLDRTLAVTRATIEHARREGVEIVALALATQRATAILWDARTGQALVPAMVWQDTRYAREMKSLASDWNERLVAVTGRPVGARSVHMWAARHVAETPAVAAAWEARQLRFGTVDTWMLWHLSEERPHVTTPTNAASAGAYRLHDHDYLDGWLEAQSFPRELLPALREDADDFGRTRQDLLGLRVPILASCGDQSGALLGLGCHEPGQAMCVHGTGSFVWLVTGERAAAKPGACDATFATVGWRCDGRSRFAVETYAAATGSALDRLCSELRWFESAREISRFAAEASSAEGLLFLPTLTGLRQPRVVPGARASLTGLSLAHGRTHLAYAVLEGIAHAAVSCAEADEASAGVRLQEIAAGGGLSSSDVLLGIQADLSGVPIRRMADAEHATLRGAAFLAGSRGLFWNSLPEARATLPEGEIFQPRIGAAERDERRANWAAAVDEEIARVSAGRYVKQEQAC